MADELKPCPFCGSPAKVDLSEFGAAMVYCNQVPNVSVDHENDCPVQPETGYFDTREEAIKQWNARTGESRAESALVALAQQHAQSGVELAKAQTLSGELADALEAVLPFALAEQEVCEASYLPDPSEEERRYLKEAANAVDTIRAALKKAGRE